MWGTGAALVRHWCVEGKEGTNETMKGMNTREKNTGIRPLILAALVLGGATLIRQPATAQEVAWTPEYAQSRIAHWSAVWGVSPDAMIAVVNCEDPAWNPAEVGALGEASYFQLHPVFWQEMVDVGAPGTVDGSRWDPETNIRVGVWAHAHGYGGQWSCAA